VPWALKKVGARLSSRKYRPAATIVICLFLASAFSIAARADAASAIDRIYGATTLYENPSNPTIQKFAFSGRIQLDYYNVEADQGNDSGWDVRRLRLGFKGDIYQSFDFRIEADLNDDPDDFYKRFTDFYLRWNSTDGVKLKVGKQSAGFTLDGHTSSNNLFTTERSILGYNVWFPLDYMPGISIAVEKTGWNTFLGLYSAGSENGEFGNFDGSWFGLGFVEYLFPETDALDKGKAILDLVYQPPDDDNSSTRPNEFVVSLSVGLRKDRWRFEGNVSATRGYGTQGDLFGFLLMPMFDLTDKLQAVVRYSTLHSNEPKGIRLGRYANRVVLGQGDRYNELYGGLNYFVDGHRLKLQLGLEWADMEDQTNSGGAYSGLGVTLAFRTCW
jgi:phosphate-selective porin OprO/OprP